MDEVIRFIQIDYLHKYCLHYFVYLARHFSERQEVDDFISADFPLELSHLILLFSSYDDTTVSTCPRTVGDLHGNVERLLFEWYFR